MLSESVPDTCPAVGLVVPKSSQVDLEPDDTEMSTLLVDDDHQDDNDHSGQPSPAVMLDVDDHQS
jgi:hypothetical protein